MHRKRTPPPRPSAGTGRRPDPDQRIQERAPISDCQIRVYPKDGGMWLFGHRPSCGTWPQDMLTCNRWFSELRKPYEWRWMSSHFAIEVFRYAIPGRGQIHHDDLDARSVRNTVLRILPHVFCFAGQNVINRVVPQIAQPRYKRLWLLGSWFGDLNPCRFLSMPPFLR